MSQTKSDERERGFDCLAFKRVAQARIFGRTKDLSIEDEITWIHDKAASGPFGEWLSRVRQASKDSRETA